MKTALMTLVCMTKTLEEVIELASEYGYDGIELWGDARHFGPDTTLERAREIKKMAKEKGLAIPAVASYVGGFSTKSDDECAKELESLEKYLGLMTEMDCPIIRVNCGGPSILRAQKYHVEKALFWMGKCAVLAKQYDKKIAMEIHNGCLIETLEAAYDFSKALANNVVGFIHDAGNMYITDTDYGEASVEILGDKIFHVHVKDELRINDDTLPGAFHATTVYGNEIFAQKRLGEGAVDHIPLFKSLIKAGYNGFMSTECHAPVSDIERAKGEIGIIRKQIETAHAELASDTG